MQAETIEDIFQDVLPEETEKKEEPKTSGYMTIEAWEASGKDPKDWVSEDVFKERTQRIKETSHLKRLLAEKDKEFDNRIKNLNAVQQAQLNRQRDELISRRDDAIDVADKAEVKRIDKQLNDLDKEAELASDKVQPPKPIEIVEWEQDNPWIFNLDDPRSKIANDAAAAAINAGKTIAYALREADKAIAKYETASEPSEIRKKPPVPMSDSSRSSVSRDAPTLNWGSLSKEEESLYEELYSHTGMTKKDYLKTVADQRKGA